MITIQEIIQVIDQWAPFTYQESYDNSGLLIGNERSEVTGALVCLDVTEEVMDEAIKDNCNLIIAHHPIIFNGIKRINGKNYVERIIIKAIQKNISILAVHTNLDNVSTGVNLALCEQLDCKPICVLQPLQHKFFKLNYYCPVAHHENVRDKLFEAGAGSIGNYDECSFNVTGTGTFKPGDGSNAFVGEIGKRQQENEIRVEMIVEQNKLSKVLKSLTEHHPYEEVAYDIFPLLNTNNQIGAGLLALMPEPMDQKSFLPWLKERTNCQLIRHTQFTGQLIEKIALCGGSGSFLVNAALSSGAQAFITSDFKYHQFFEADQGILIADIGHFESECFIIKRLHNFLNKKFTNLALRLTELNTNPVKYF